MFHFTIRVEMYFSIGNHWPSTRTMHPCMGPKELCICIARARLSQDHPAINATKPNTTAKIATIVAVNMHPITKPSLIFPSASVVVDHQSGIHAIRSG
jgi:hypothetical protein